jgi:hypothetical protein
MTANVSAVESALTASEVEVARCYVQQTGMAVREAVEGLSEAQWQFRPAPESWSIAENVEHMAVVQELVLGPVRQSLATAPVLVGGDPRPLDALVLALFPVRTRRFPAPATARPAGRWSPAESLERLAANCGRLVEFLESTPDLRQHHVESRPLKALTDGAHQYMDGYQWVLAIAGHTARHTAQILEIKADAAFPAA